MADDWQPGDLALCVNAGPITRDGWSHMGGGLIGGRVYTVIGFGVDPADRELTLWLVDDIPDGRIASRFRKIRPHAPDAEDAETIRLLNGQPALPTRPREVV